MVVFITYSMVYKKFKQSTDRSMNTSESPSNKVLRSIRRRRRTNILLVLMSLVFFVSWAPLNIVSVTLKFTDFELLVKIFS